MVASSSKVKSGSPKSLSTASIIKRLGLKRDDEGALLIDPSDVLPNPDNPHDELRDIPELAGSIKEVNCQQQPGLVRFFNQNGRWMIQLVDGSRRHAAIEYLRKQGESKWLFRAFPKSDIKNGHDHFRASFAANFSKDEHNCMEVARSVKKLLDGGDDPLAIARLAGKNSVTWVMQHLSLLKLEPTIQQMLVAADSMKGTRQKGRMTFTLALPLTKLPHKQQLRQAATITKEKMSMVQARRHILKEGGDTMSPKQRLFSLMRFTEKLPDELGIFNDMDETALALMVESAPPAARALLAQRLNTLLGDFNKLAERIKVRIAACQ